MGKKFWHSMATESLIQEGEASKQPLIQEDEALQQRAEVLAEVKESDDEWDSKGGKKNSKGGATGGTWGTLATVPRKCRPKQSLYFTVNNHIQPAKVRIAPSGKLAFISGGTKHGWISLSCIVYKAGNGSFKNVGPKKLRIDSVRQGAARKHNGWKGSATAYKQGRLCSLFGDLKGGRAWKGKILTLPTWCRPPGKLMFAMSQGKNAFRIDVTSSGHVIPVSVSRKISKKINLSSIVFSTARGSGVKPMHGFKKPNTGSKAQARRMGTVCVVSGSLYNAKIRSGVHCTLKHSGAVAKLPKWCRPTKRMIFSTIATDGKIQRIDVLPQGSVRWTAGKRDKIVNLTGIKFTIPTSVAKKYSKALLKTRKCA